MEPWVDIVRDRLGQESDSALAREAGVSRERVRQVRERLGIPPRLLGMTPARRAVHQALLAGEEVWLREVAERVYGENSEITRGRARQNLGWLVENEYVERVVRGRYRALREA